MLYWWRQQQLIRISNHYQARSNDELAQRNASLHYTDNGNGSIDEEEEFELFKLPPELAAMIMIAEAKESSYPAAAPTLGSKSSTSEGDGGESCSSKSSSKLESWEESYASLDDCCEGSFSWDYDACIMGSWSLFRVGGWKQIMLCEWCRIFCYIMRYGMKQIYNVV